jgi:C-terminal processing protease CtpA/Prc
MMMQKVPGAKLIGQRSQGSSGNPKPHDLGNGVTVYVPSWRDLNVDGTDLEGVGIAPDIEVKTSPADFTNGDPVLEAGLKYLRDE